jgi:hypothetical protein
VKVSEKAAMSTMPAAPEAVVDRSIDTIIDHGVTLAFIIRHTYSSEGVSFFTPPEFSQQLAHIEHPAGKRIAAHVHNVILREVKFTQEVLVIKKGKLRVDFYGLDLHYVCSRTLEAGDVILLSSGGHGFEVLEDVAFVEIKQGPYMGDQDKVRFDPVRFDCNRA